MGEVDKKSVDRATQIMIEKAAVDGCETIFDRAETMKPFDKKRKVLGIDKARERILFDMAKRRELEAA